MAQVSRSVSIAVLLVITATLLVSTMPPVQPAGRVALAFRSPPEGLVDGDIVFRTGTDVLARLVLTQSQHSRFSHVGVVVKIAHTPYVVHAAPGDDGRDGGVRIDPLDHFISPKMAIDVGYYRIDELHDTQRERLKTYLFSQIGRPFDYRFSHTDDGALYCTELVLKALIHVGVKLESLDRVTVISLPEPATPPDSLRASGKLRELASSDTVPSKTLKLSITK